MLTVPGRGAPNLAQMIMKAEKMTDMGTHADVHAAAGRPLRRASRAAWSVFLGMAATTMAFQVFHAVRFGGMPWELAVLYGTVPLGISIGVLMFSACWESRWLRAGAYAVTAGSMFLSASATGDVVLRAAPPHWSLLFGVILDAAALLSVHFIFNGPTARQAVAEVAQREAQLTAQADAQRQALEEAQSAHRAALADARSAHEQEVRQLLGDLSTARAATQEAQAETALRAAAETARDIARAELDGARSGLQAAQDARADAESRAQRAEAERDRLARKIGAQNGGTRARKGTPAQASGSVPKDVDARAEALGLFLSQPDISGAELGVTVGMSKRWGQDRMKEFKTGVTGGDAAASDS